MIQWNHPAYDLNHTTATGPGPWFLFYGLIGYPLDKTISHFVHNKVIRALGIDAVYLKMPLLEEELSPFFQMARRWPISGLSVTRPYKEKVIPFLDELDIEAKKMGAVNTIVRKENRLIGYNTDGKGAIDALEKRIGPLTGKKIVLIGAGGAAKAVGYAAKQQGAHVVVVNRTKARAEALCDLLGGNVEAKGLDEIPKEYDVLVNTTPEACPCDFAHLLPDALFMDITIALCLMPESLFAMAKKSGFKVISGHEMFINQAIGQVELWFGKQNSTIAEIIAKEVARHGGTA